MFLLKGKDPIYQQIKHQIIRYIQTGVLKPNDKLQSVRAIAADLTINPNTVQKAYSELEEEGYIYTIPQKGSFVSNKLVNDVDDYLYNIIKILREKGYSQQKLIEVIKEVYHDRD